MDPKVFWLIALVLIGVSGSLLIFARRYRNSDEDAGKGIAAWTVVLLVQWLIAASRLLR